MAKASAIVVSLVVTRNRFWFGDQNSKLHPFWPVRLSGAPFEDIHRVALSLLQDVLVAKFYCWRSNRRRAGPGGSEWRHQALLCTAGAVSFACAAIRTRSDSLLVVSGSPTLPDLASLNLPMRCPCVLPTMNAKVLPRRSSASANCQRRSRGRAKSESSCARP